MRTIVTVLALVLSLAAKAQGERVTIVELNVENLFDTRHDSLKNDHDFLPDSQQRWTRTRYWRKLNRLGQTIVACGRDSSGWASVDLVALCEVENDTVMRDLTRRSLLRTARYEYVVTDSPDERGIDVALLYSPFTFRLLGWRALRVPPIKDMRATRDVLYAKGELLWGDTLHVVVAHAPSRRGGEMATRKLRCHVARAICQLTDSIRREESDAKIVLLGDFNAYTGEPSLNIIEQNGLTDVSRHATGTHGARATYRYQGRWASLDHIFVSTPLLPRVGQCRVVDEPFLMEEDTKYGGWKPRRNYQGPVYRNGFSDHLPLLLSLVFGSGRGR